MRQFSFGDRSTHSSTRLPMKLLTGAFYKSGGACFTLVSWKRLRNYFRIALPNKSSDSRITHPGAGCGKRPWTIFIRPAKKLPATPPLGRR